MGWCVVVLVRWCDSEIYQVVFHYSLLANCLVQTCQCWKYGQLGAHLQLSQSFCIWGRLNLSPRAHWFTLRNVPKAPLASKPQGSKPVCSLIVSITCTCVAGKVILKTKVSLVCKGRLCSCLLQALKNSSRNGSIHVRRANLKLIWGEAWIILWLWKESFLHFVISPCHGIFMVYEAFVTSWQSTCCCSTTSVVSNWVVPDWDIYWGLV